MFMSILFGVQSQFAFAVSPYSHSASSSHRNVSCCGDHSSSFMEFHYVNHHCINLCGRGEKLEEARVRASPFLCRTFFGGRVDKLRFLQFWVVLSLLVIQSSSAAEDSNSPCWTTECQQFSLMLSNMNVSADPCQDFYEFACGHFSLKNPRGGRASYGVSQLLQEYNENRLADLLEDLEADDTAIGKPGVFYRACDRTANLATDNVLVLVDIINSLGGMPVLGTWNATSYNLPHVLTELILEHDVQPLFQLTLGTFTDKLTHIYLEKPSGVSYKPHSLRSTVPRAVPDRFRIMDGMNRLRKAADMNSTFEMKDCNESCVVQTVNDILDVYYRLDGVYKPYRSLRLVFTTDRFTNESSSKVISELVQFLSLNDSQENAMFQPRFPGPGILLDKMIALIRETTPRKLQNYLMWNLIEEYLWLLQPEFEPPEHLTTTESGGQYSSKASRHQVCIGQMNRYLEPLMQTLFTVHHIGVDNVAQASNLVWEIEAAWIGNVSQSGRSIQFLFGSSNLNESMLNDKYANLSVKDEDPFSNFRSLKLIRLETLNGQAVESYISWFLLKNHRHIDPEFLSFTNTVVVPYGSLQPPWFSGVLPEALNTAAIGSRVFKLLVQSILWNLIFDHSGSPLVWIELNLSRYQICIVEMFNSTVDRVSSDGWEPQRDVQMVGPPYPNATVLSGQQYDALQEYFAYQLTSRLYRKLKPRMYRTVQPSAPPQFPPLTAMTTDQLFYLVYAQGRCQNLQSEFSDVEKLPQKEIVNFLLHNDPAFRTAYQCTSTPPRYFSGQQCSSPAAHRPVDDGYKSLLL